MITNDYPNRDALRKAQDIYLDAMCAFIVRCLDQIPGETAEDIIKKTCRDDPHFNIKDNIKDAIDFKDIPYLFRNYWENSFERHFNRVDPYCEARSVVQLIVQGRNRASHPPWDLDLEFTRTQLFMIAELLGKIDRPNKQREVEEIREDLFSDDTKECLEEAEERLKIAESEKHESEKSKAELAQRLAETEKRLEKTESEKRESEKSKKELSQQLIDNALKIENTSKQLKDAKAENYEYKKNLAEKNKCLEESEAAQSDYKERLETESKELKDTKAELLVSKENLADVSSQLTAMQTEKKDAEEHITNIEKQLVAIKTEKSNIDERFFLFRNLLNIIIDNQSVKHIYPNLSAGFQVCLIDKRNTDKRDYLLNLLELKQPSIIYVKSEQMINQFLTLVGDEIAAVIGKHNEQTTNAEEIELLEKLENSDLIAIVSDATFSSLPEQHCVEHFVFCHPVLGLDAFFKRCQSAFTSVQNAYLHLIYDSTQDFQDTIEELNKKYPDREAIKELYRGMQKFVDTKDSFVDLDNVNNELDIVKVGIETGLSIFEELGFIERNQEGIKLLPNVEKKELDESETYYTGEKLKREITEFQTFQSEHSIEQIWDILLENVGVDKNQITQERDAQIAEIINNSQPITDYEQDGVSSLIPNVWPQRGISSFNSLRQLAAKNFSESNTLLCEKNKRSYSEGMRSHSQVGAFEENKFSPEHDYQNKYYLAKQFAEEHGISALEQGITELIEDRDDPDYNFTEDETEMLLAFQDALRNFEKQSGESDQVVNNSGKEAIENNR